MINDLIIRVEFESNVYDLQVDSNIPLRLDMSAVESQELGKFFGVGSQRFDLPGNRISNKFFNHAYDVSVDDIPAMYNTLPCSVILNGETVLQGTLHLFEVIASEDGYITYKVEVVDKVVQLNEALGSKLIKDGDWSAYTHTISSASILDSWTDNLLSGSIFYPLVEYGRDKEESYPALPRMQEGTGPGAIGNTLTPLRAQQFLPAIKVKDTMDVVFNQVGFAYTGLFTETDDFNQLFILPKGKDGLGITAGSTETATFNAGANSNQTVLLNTTVHVTASSEFSDPQNAYNTVTSTYTYPSDGDYQFSGQISFFNPVAGDPSSNVSVTLELRSGFSYIAYSVIDSDTVALTSLDGFSKKYLNVANFGPHTAGDKAWLVVTYVKTAGAGTPFNLTLQQFDTEFKCTEAPVAYEGGTVDMSVQWSPDTKSVDILRGLIQQFNLVMTPSNDGSNTITIETFDKWMRDGETKDWTYRYDTAKRKSISHTVDDLEREVFLKNADDSDRFSKLAIESVPNDQYGTLRLLSDSNIPQGEKTIGDFFGPVILGGPLLYNATGSAGGYTFETDLNSRMVIPHLYKLESSAQKSFAFKPRIGYKVTNQMPSGSIGYVGTSAGSTQFNTTYSTISNLSSLPAIEGSTNDLHFNNTYTLFTGAALNMNSGTNSYRNYWKSYLDSIYWEGSKKVSLDLYFEPHEYKSIKLNDKIIIKNQIFRINKISGFNVSYPDVVNVELIKLYPEYWQLS